MPSRDDSPPYELVNRTPSSRNSVSKHMQNGSEADEDWFKTATPCDVEDNNDENKYCAFRFVITDEKGQPLQGGQGTGPSQQPRFEKVYFGENTYVTFGEPDEQNRNHGWRTCMEDSELAAWKPKAQRTEFYSLSPPPKHNNGYISFGNKRTVPKQVKLAYSMLNDQNKLIFIPIESLVETRKCAPRNKPMNASQRIMQRLLNGSTGHPIFYKGHMSSTDGVWRPVHDDESEDVATMRSNQFAPSEPASAAELMQAIAEGRVNMTM